MSQPNVPVILTAAARSAPARRKPEPARDRVRITPRVRNAIHDMVWRGLDVAEAAAAHSMHGGAFARALTRPSVQALIRSEVEVLKASAKPSAARRIIDLAHQDLNLNVALKAAVHIDTDGKAGGATVQVNTQVNITPGYVIDVSEFAHQIPNLTVGRAK